MTAPVRHVHHGRLCWCVPGAFGFPLRFRRRRDAVRYQRTNLRLMAAAEQRLRRFQRLWARTALIGRQGRLAV